MRLERLSTCNGAYFLSAFSLYEAAFPQEERREISEQKRVMEKKDYHFDLILDGEVLIGIMLYWEVGDLIFLEHFATAPHVRGKGYGTKALDILKEKGKVILLEIEPPQNEITVRRFAFYKRNGFCMNPFYHIQAKYRLGDEDLELKVLSFPRALTAEEYHRFYAYMTREIGIKPHLSDAVTVRPLADTDDRLQVARLIYLSDPYIYPNWFDTMEQGQRVIAEMIGLPTLYARENITVAVTGDNVIAGAIVARMTPFTEEKQYLQLAFAQAGMEPDGRTEQVHCDYYSKMGHAEDGYYIANLAVDPAYRKRGIGAALLEHVTREKHCCTLECVAANSGSWRLYERFGFRIAYEYPGVHDVPCYKMIYRR